MSKGHDHEREVVSKGPGGSWPLRTWGIMSERSMRASAHRPAPRRLAMFTPVQKEGEEREGGRERERERERAREGERE